MFVSKYRVFHLLMHLGWVDFDLGVPPSCPAAQPLLPRSHQPRQNCADSGTLKIKVNPSQGNEQLAYPVQCSPLVRPEDVYKHILVLNGTLH